MRIGGVQQIPLTVDVIAAALCDRQRVGSGCKVVNPVRGAHEAAACHNIILVHACNGIDGKDILVYRSADVYPYVERAVLLRNTVEAGRGMRLHIGGYAVEIGEGEHIGTAAVGIPQDVVEHRLAPGDVRRGTFHHRCRARVETSFP